MTTWKEEMVRTLERDIHNYLTRVTTRTHIHTQTHTYYTHTMHTINIMKQKTTYYNISQFQIFRIVLINEVNILQYTFMCLNTSL